MWFSSSDEKMCNRYLCGLATLYNGGEGFSGDDFGGSEGENLT